MIPLQSQTLSEGSSFRLFCSTSAGDRPLFFQWTKSGQILSNNPQNNYKIDNSEEFSVFNIKSVDRNDAGNYSCIVRNAFGEDIMFSQLIVKGLKFKTILLFDCWNSCLCSVAPKWIIEPKDIKINSDKQFSIECRADGEPKPTIKWFDSKGYND